MFLCKFKTDINMIHNIKSTVAALTLMSLLILGFQKDILKLDDPNKISADLFYTNEKEALFGLYGIYDAYQSINLMGNHFNSFNIISDDLANNNSIDGFRAFELSNQEPFSNPRVLNFYLHFYTVINRASYVIDKVDKMTSSQINDLNKKRIIAEASFLRDFSYFMLTNLYRDVPFYMEPQGIHTTFLGPTLKSEIWKFLKGDLTQKVQDLPLSIPASENGRISRGAAITLLGQIYLYEKDYLNAEAILRPLLSAPYSYSLYPDYNKLFTPAGEYSSESIFEINFDASGADRGVNDAGNPVVNGSVFSTTIDTNQQIAKPKNNLTPANKFVDSYLCKDGKPIVNSTLYGTKSPMYDASTPEGKFNSRDPRLRATVLTSADVLPSGKKLWKWTSNTTYAVKKYVEITSAQYPSNPQNFYVYRFADVLLMYAEAQNELLAAPGISVYNSVNKVRKRVNMPDYPLGLTKQQMRERIRDERRWEFGLEYYRYFDLKRWGIIQDAITNSGVSQKAFTNPRDYVWPIPQAELDVNTKMVQAVEWK